jgi:predicted nucleotidyltransferase component of viral defense system
MIGAAEVRERAREWSLREHVVEKDYVLGWFLWAIGTEPTLSPSWVFKGGTCLKKCYFETYRFSEDLDFTARDEESLDPDALHGIFATIGGRIYEASGIEVPRELIRFEAYTTRRGRRAVEGRVSYRGPLQPRGDLPRLKLDLTADEILVQEAVPRQVAHPFTDGLPDGATIQCYSMSEVFAEKIRALSERCLPRDLYDVVSIHRHPDLALEPRDVHSVLQRKCAHKGIAVPTLEAINQLIATGELAGEWENMLRHQLPELPPFAAFLAELQSLFEWLTPRPAAVPGTPRIPVQPRLPVRRVAAPMPAPPMPLDPRWSAPLTIRAWGASSPVERIRFAAANRLCVDLGYDGSTRRIEPYGLKRTTAGDLLISAVRRDSGEPRHYRVDRIESAKVTDEVFQPRFPIDLWGVGGSDARQMATSPAVSRTRQPRRPFGGQRVSTRSGGPRYVVQCSSCGKQFRRRDTHLAKHKMKGNRYFDCSGRNGFIVRWLP